MAAGISSATWKDLVGHVRVCYPELARSWFECLKPVELTNGVLAVNADNNAQVRYLSEHCRRACAEAAQACMGRLISICFETDQEQPAQPPLSFERDDALLKLSGDCLFENFITGPCNRLAHAAAIAVSEAPGRAYNPLFVYGDVGLGKTHLLQAVCHEIQKRQPRMKILYISCETFTDHFLEAVERGAMNQFRYRYHHVDLLAIDDVQFLAERERSQEEFFHTFNRLHQSQKQIVLSADLCPSDLPSLGDRLVSRFNSGLVASVDKPCLETRIAIVRAKAKLRCIEIPEDVAKLVASKIESNVRELEGALARIHLLSQTRGGPIDIETAMEALGFASQRQAVGIHEILNLVSKQFSVRLSDLQGKRRTRSITFPRQICMYLARELTPLSLQEIGGYFGGRDHTTVLHATRLLRAKREQEPALHLTLEQLMTTLKNRTDLRP